MEGTSHPGTPTLRDNAAGGSGSGPHGTPGIPLELVKLFRVHAPLYPVGPPAGVAGAGGSRPGRGWDAPRLHLRVFTVLRPDQLAQVSD